MRTAVPRLTAANRLVAYCRHSGSLTVAPELQAFQAFLVKTMDEKDQLRKQMVAEATEERERAELRANELRKQMVAEANEQRERAESRANEERKQMAAEMAKIDKELDQKASSLTLLKTSHEKYRDEVGLRTLVGTQPIAF